ncbi:hypothetical protein [Acinetobacter baumannii]|uniref:hypothetical protein n=1 Tax=Acinetobacter baumannii TaxID=470 RepID=UPI0023400264|nr:hypothetical protein [Acinetobacter baumannii]MDC4146516.1 hypothetical protein [Acinetobacter baumannii]
MGVDDLKEAIAKGYLGGKLTTPKTIKFTDEMLDAVAVQAEVEDKDQADWIREVIAKALLVADAKYERMTRARMKAKCTSGTLVHQKESPVGATTEPDVQ